MPSSFANKTKERVYLEMERTLDYFEKKVKYKGKRAGMTKELAGLIDSKLIEPDDALLGLEILTRAFIYDESRPGQENYFDREHAKGISLAILGIDDLEKRQNYPAMKHYIQKPT